MVEAGYGSLCERRSGPGPVLPALLPLLALVLASCSFGREKPSGLLGQRPPPTRITLLDGSYHAFSEYHGKKVVLVFWTHWCAYSAPVVERLDKLAEKHARDDVVFLAVSIDEN